MSVDKRIKYLNDRAPKGEFLAYINKKEAAMLKKAGGSGKPVNGIPSFRPQDMGNKSNQKASAANTGMGGSRKGPDKGTGGSKGNIGGGGGGQDSDYRRYSPPTKKTYTSKTIDSKPITGADFRRSQNDFINTLNKNNQIRAQQTGTKFTPYQGGARTTDYYNPNPLKGLLKLAAGFAIPGAGFLINQGGRLKDGLMSLNNRIQNSDFGRSTSLMDYLDMKKYGGYDEREMARRINMDESKNLQARIDAGEFDGLDTMIDEVALTEGTPGKFNRDFDINEISSLIEASQVPQKTTLDLNDLSTAFTTNMGQSRMTPEMEKFYTEQMMKQNPSLYDELNPVEIAPSYELRNDGSFRPYKYNYNPEEGIMGIDVGYPSNDLMADASAPGNNFLYNTGNPYKDNLYDSEGNYDPYGIKGEEPEVKEIAIG
jgi:ribosomal protein L34E